MSAPSHELRFAGTIAALEQAARSLAAWLDTQGVSGDTRYNVELAFEEVGANIVRHGHPASEVEVRVDHTEDGILLTFEDDGVAFDPRHVPDPPAPASIDDAPVGGLGLFLVRRISTRLAYERTSRHYNRLTLLVP